MRGHKRLFFFVITSLWQIEIKKKKKKRNVSIVATVAAFSRTRRPTVVVLRLHNTRPHRIHEIPYARRRSYGSVQ
jgi:hypothetical protein